MSRYVATFHTHLAALLTARALQKAGTEAKMAQVPQEELSFLGTGAILASTPASLRVRAVIRADRWVWMVAM